MAGLYLHIPFCKQKCTYCDFHFSTKLDNRGEVIDAMVNEIGQRSKVEVGSIYFGGGTPSLLTKSELDKVFEAIYKNYSVDENAEITLEANPDDLSDTTLETLGSSPINRLSIGIQSFDDEVLTWMNRAHRSDEAIRSVKRAQDLGFDNITFDLIFGIPGKEMGYWEEQLHLGIELDVPHLSVYQLTVEERTALHHQVSRGRVRIPSDEDIAAQFLRADEFLARSGYDHYEVSNYAKPGKRATHNTSYWEEEPYIGVGPSAHSYDGVRRRWNIANNREYVRRVNSDESFWEEEELSKKDRFNEYIMTRIRTKWGIDRDLIAENYPEFLESYQAAIAPFIARGMVESVNNQDIPTLEGWLVSDHIASELFIA